jgi:hypothetical protein
MRLAAIGLKPAKRRKWESFQFVNGLSFVWNHVSRYMPLHAIA